MTNAYKGGKRLKKPKKPIDSGEETTEEVPEAKAAQTNKAYKVARARGDSKPKKIVIIPEPVHDAPKITAADTNRAYRSARLIGQSKIELPSEPASLLNEQVIVSPVGTDKTEWADSNSIGGPPGDPGLGIPEGGFINQHLVKNSGEDYDTAWRYGNGSTPEYPPNGLKGAILRKVTGSDNHVDWSDPTGGDPQARPPSIGTKAVLNGGFF